MSFKVTVETNDIDSYRWYVNGSNSKTTLPASQKTFNVINRSSSQSNLTTGDVVGFTYFMQYVIPRDILQNPSIWADNGLNPQFQSGQSNVIDVNHSSTHFYAPICGIIPYMDDGQSYYDCDYSTGTDRYGDPSIGFPIVSQYGYTNQYTRFTGDIIPRKDKVLGGQMSALKTFEPPHKAKNPAISGWAFPKSFSDTHYFSQFNTYSGWDKYVNQSGDYNLLPDVSDTVITNKLPHPGYLMWGGDNYGNNQIMFNGRQDTNLNNLKLQFKDEIFQKLATSGSLQASINKILPNFQNQPNGRTVGSNYSQDISTMLHGTFYLQNTIHQRSPGFMFGLIEAVKIGLKTFKLEVERLTDFNSSGYFKDTGYSITPGMYNGLTRAWVYKLGEEVQDVWVDHGKYGDLWENEWYAWKWQKYKHNKSFDQGYS